MKIQVKARGKGTLLTAVNSCELEVTLSQVGAGVYSVRYLGEPMNMGPSDVDHYLGDHSSFYGKTIAPFAGRVPMGLLKVGEKEFHLPMTSEGVSLHSGTLNAAFRLFDCEIRKAKDGMDVVFSTLLPASEGFQTEIPFQVRYFIFDRVPRFDVFFEAKPKEDVPFNPTTHLYWNLGGKADVLHHTLLLHSHFYSSYDASLLPLEKLACNKEMDFTSGKEVGKDLFAPELQNSPTHGYDNAFYLDSVKGPAAILESKDFGMRIKTDAPVLQIYSVNFPQKGQRLLSGEKEIRHSGITFEPVGDLLSPDQNHALAESDFSRFISYEFYSKKGSSHD